MTFLHPEIGWWLVAGFALLVVARWRAPGRFAAATAVARIDPSSRASLLRRLPHLVLLAALALMGCALMDPVLPYSESTVHSRGLDIIVVLDLSSSMQEPMEPLSQAAGSHPALVSQAAGSHPALVSQAAGSHPALAKRTSKTRLEATKDAVKAFVSHRRDDRLGLVVFSDNPYVISPLTVDREYLARYIDIVDDRILRGEGMTAIGDGLALANYLLSREAAMRTRRNRVIVLFTDGENNRGRDPVEVLRESQAAGIRVHMVGVDLEPDVQRKPEVQKLVGTIRRHGGRYFDAASVRDLDTASRAIDALEKGSLVSRMYVRNLPVYQWFAVPAVVALVAAMGLRAVPFFVDLT